MKEQARKGVQVLKRRKPAQQQGAVDPLELFYASIGYLGVFYESQLIYLKHKLDEIQVSDRDHVLIKGLEASHTFAISLCSRFFAREPLEQAIVREFTEASGRAIKELAAEGKELMRQIEQGRDKQ